MLAGKWPHKDLPLGISYDRSAEKEGRDPWGYTEQAESVKAAFQAVANGATIQEAATLMGYCRKGAKNIISNPIYKGLSKPGDMVRVFSPDRQLVDDALWARANARASRNGGAAWQKVRATTIETAPFSGLLESAMPIPSGLFSFPDRCYHSIYSYGRGEGRYICRCHTGRDSLPKDQQCGFGSPPAKEINKGVAEYLRRLTSEAATIRAIKLALSEPAKDTAVEKAKLAKVVKDCEKKEKTLTDLLLDGRIDRAEHDKRQDKIRKERNDARTALDALFSQATTSPQDIDQMAKEWQFDPAWTPSKQRAWVKQYCRSIVISNRGVEFAVIRIPGTTAMVSVDLVGARWVDGESYRQVSYPDAKKGQEDDFISWSDLGAKLRARRGTTAAYLARQAARQ
jgi:hypothetical protein